MSTLIDRTRIESAAPSLHSDEPAAESRPFAARLMGLGTAVPARRWPQQEVRDVLAAAWGLRGAGLDRWHRIVAGTGIDSRHGILPLGEIIHRSTAERMQLYETHASALAEAAARRSLESCGVEPGQVTDLIVVSCTGFSAPGVDVDLVMRLGLRRDVRRTIVGFMGCFGAISGLRTAVGACAADPRSAALVVCVELCSLHVRAETDVQNQVASALFGDGAAAAVVAGEQALLEDSPRTVVRASCPHNTGRMPVPPIGRITQGAALLMEEGRDWMTWKITDAGFAMTLARQVPDALRQALNGFVRTASNGVRPRTFIVHPGGPGILDAADEALELDGGCGLESSRRVLARVGNVSSATVLFVLEQALRDGCKLPAMMLAFGPGLTIESLLVL